MHQKEYSLEIGGKTLTALFSDLADQAHGSVILKYGNTAVMATAVMSKRPREGGDFFPLTVDYEERFYAAGQILGSRFVRREGKPSDEAVLSGRVVDRTIRPLFDHRMRYEVQVVLTVLAIDKEDPDFLAVVAASLALATSEIPWSGPVAAVGLARVGETWVSLPPAKNDEGEAISYDATFTVCGKDGTISMIEMGGAELSEIVVMEGLARAAQDLATIEAWQKEIVAAIGKPKRAVVLPEADDAIKALFAEQIAPRFAATIFAGEAGRAKEYALCDEFIALAEAAELSPSLAAAYFDDQVNDLLHARAIDANERPDGRDFDTVRPLFAQAGGISPLHHGAGIFYRGGTHVLSVLTLGGPNDAQLVEGMEVQEKKRYIHHYNFPPFSSGETGRMGGTNRRMIGHGALAEKALLPVLPSKESFPYTIRIVSESMASNGSTSMASVCGSTLSLFDAGVPITKPVAGIASGLMMRSHTEYKVLTDIQGPEDHHGDMDFKVAGTKDGVTAIQMDVKVDGVPLPILGEAFAKAKAARLHILETMTAAIPAPRADISPYAPKIIAVKIKPEQIGMIIGSGGKTVNAIREETGAEIDIEDDGTVFVTGKHGAAEKARDIIAEMTHEYVAGERFDAEVVKLVEFGAFVRIGHSAEGLVHVSEIAPFRIAQVADYLSVGMKVPVMVKEIDERGRLSLSIKRANPDFLKPKDGETGGVPPRPVDAPHAFRPPHHDVPGGMHPTHDRGH